MLHEVGSPYLIPVHLHFILLLIHVYIVNLDILKQIDASLLLPLGEYLGDRRSPSLLTLLTDLLYLTPVHRLVMYFVHYFF